VADLAALVIYAVRTGGSDASVGKTITTNESLTADGRGTLGTNRQIVASTYRSKQKILAERSAFVTGEALADGSATFGQRMMTRGIKLIFVLFWLLFVSIGLMQMKSNIVFALFIILPSIWFFNCVRL
jgi:hypothetical protein